MRYDEYNKQKALNPPKSKEEEDKLDRVFMINILKSFNHVVDTGDKEVTDKLQEEWTNDLKEMDKRLKEDYGTNGLNEIEEKLKKDYKVQTN